ncbi:uncharacterized protein LOC126772985 [Nymphalis io]|uniref:uncharacterized protein LOC126772985 n=1 Tax=Inachis io TaxID=171585 RepID=UPI00216A2860|nr:uncharacterized protein LOC126772985 [Nymphalis io]
MRYRLQAVILLLLCLVTLEAKEPELPLCPTNIQFFPQNLPMHCRMPVTSPPISGKSMEYFRMPGFPGALPGPMQGMMPGPMPMMPQPPAHKLPVVVMPMYSPESKNSQGIHSFRLRHKKHRLGFKRRPKHYYHSDEDSTDDDTSSDDSSDTSTEFGRRKISRNGRRSNRRRSKKKKHQNKDLLTPVLQYVTKDGYVIFEKQISKDEAKNWLGNKKVDSNKQSRQPKNDDNQDSRESRDDNGGTKILKREEDNIEVKIQGNPQFHQKKVPKRKPPKKHEAE